MKSYMRYDDVCTILGNGDIGKGQILLRAIAERLGHARHKHPHYADDKSEAVTVILAEFDEYAEAVDQEQGEDRERDELLDVIATAVRAYNQEWA